MLQLQCDYTGGCLPEILQEITTTNNSVLPGYGEDLYCQKAQELILKAAGLPNGRVFWVTSGTLSNLTTLSALTPAGAAIVCAETGHILTAEAGALQATGHALIPVKSADGKIRAQDLENLFSDFENADEISRSHRCRPGSVYITHPTETGTLYTKDELAQLGDVCRRYAIPLYLDGARLAYGLAAGGPNLTNIARYTDAFYIGGTKCGALIGEAVVIKDACVARYFLNSVRMRGALVAKGRLIGLEFSAFFRNGLYERLGHQAVMDAKRIAEAFAKAGVKLHYPTQANLIFPKLTDLQKKSLEKICRFNTVSRNCDGSTTVRLCTSWSTTADEVNTLIESIRHLS